MMNIICCFAYLTRVRLKMKTMFIKTAPLKFSQVSNNFDANKQIFQQRKLSSMNKLIVG